MYILNSPLQKNLYVFTIFIRQKDGNFIIKANDLIRIEADIYLWIFKAQMITLKLKYGKYAEGYFLLIAIHLLNYLQMIVVKQFEN